MLTWIAGTGAALCLLYYILIIIYAGFSTSLSWIWLLAAGYLGMVAWGSRYCRLHPRKVPLWITVPVMTCLGAALAVIAAVMVFVFLGVTTADTPGLDYVIVLGAKVREDGISNSLKMRLDKAVEYSGESPNTVFILSGGQGRDEPEPEAQAMYRYMIDQGVPASRLVQEPLSSSTAENIAYSRVVIDRLEQEKREPAEASERRVAPGPFVQVEEKPVQIGVLTSSYHVFRATMIAKKRGIENVRGISARSDIPLFIHLCLRECLAIIKDRLMGNL